MNNKRRIRFDEMFFGGLGKIFSVPLGLLFNQFEYTRNHFVPLYTLIHKSFVRSGAFPFLTFIFPLIFISILGHIVDPMSTTFSLATYIPLVVGIQVLPSAIINYKQSSLLKRIGATTIKTWVLMFCFITYYTFASVISILFNVGMGILMYQSKPDFDMGKILWFYLIVSIIIQMLLAFSIGIFIAAVITQPGGALAIGLLILIPGAFLSGQFLPPVLVNKVEVLRYIGWIFPQKGPTMLTNAAISGENPFHIGIKKVFDPNASAFLDYASKPENWQYLSPEIRQAVENPQLWAAFRSEYLATHRLELISSAENVVSIVIPLVAAGASLGLGAHLFKWQSR